MATWYEVIDGVTAEKIARVMKKHYPELCEQRVTISGLMAFSDSGHPCTSGGYKCNAFIRVLPGRERVKGAADAEITCDAEVFDRMNIEEQLALIDHELYHIELAKRNGKVKRDRYDRPIIGMKLHDYQFGWFKEVARRNGANSIEVQQAHFMVQQTGQLFFPFALPGVDINDPSPTDGRVSEFESESDAQEQSIEEVISHAIDPVKAVEMTAKMLGIRDSFKRFAGDEYAKMVKMTRDVIEREVEATGEKVISVVIRLAREALENEGALRKHDAFIAAYVEMNDPKAAGGPPEDLTSTIIKTFEAIPVDKFLYENGFNARVIRALSDAAIRTGADLRGWVNQEYRKKIPGISLDTAQKIADAVADWMVNQTTAKK